MQLWTHKKNVHTQCSTEQDISYPLSYTLCPKSFIIEQEARFVPRWEEQTWSTALVTVWTSHTLKHLQVCWSQVKSIFCKAFPDLQGRNVVKNVSLVILFLFLAISSSFLCATLTLGYYHIVSHVHLCCLLQKRTILQNTISPLTAQQWLHFWSMCISNKTLNHL